MKPHGFSHVLNVRLLPSRSLFAALFVGLFMALAAGPVRAGVFNPETFTLENGMQVVVVTNKRVPVVTHMVWYKAGSMDEPVGRTGIAHLLEHLMFKGTETMKAGEFSRLLARNGGRENAFTSLDYTAYFQTVARDRLEMVMRLEADRMSNLVLTQEEMDTERLVVLEERSQRTDNDPNGILREHVQAALFMNHPYGRPVIGWEHELRVLSLDDVKAFYETWYTPANAVLVVAGDITADELRPLAEKYYGVIPARAVPARVDITEPTAKADRTVELADGRVRQPGWSRVVIAPGPRDDAREGVPGRAEALEVANDILGSGASSHLYRALVIDAKVAVSAGSFYDGGGRGPGRFGLWASPAPGVALDDLQAAMDQAVTQFLEEGVSADDVARAKKRLLSDAVYARDSIGQAARALGAALVSGQTVEQVESWPDRISAVTTDRVMAEIRAVFARPGWVTARLLPAKAEGDGK